MKDIWKIIGMPLRLVMAVFLFMFYGLAVMIYSMFDHRCNHAHIKMWAELYGYVKTGDADYYILSEDHKDKHHRDHHKLV